MYPQTYLKQLEMEESLFLLYDYICTYIKEKENKESNRKEFWHIFDVRPNYVWMIKHIKNAQYDGACLPDYDNKYRM